MAAHLQVQVPAALARLVPAARPLPVPRADPHPQVARLLVLAAHLQVHRHPAALLITGPTGVKPATVKKVKALVDPTC